MKKNLLLIKIQSLLLLVIFTTGCNPSRKLHEREYLLVKNRVEIDNKDIDSYDIEGFIKQEPNKKVLRIVPLQISAYFYANNGKETGFKGWLKRTMAKAPTIYDASLTDNTIKQMRLYLCSKGYFNGNATRTIDTIKKKVKVNYYIKASKPYKYRKISIKIDDQIVKTLVLSKIENSLIKSGDNYDVDILDNERDRITIDLKNVGYFYFTKDYIKYKIDSALDKHCLDLTMHILSKQIPSKADPEKMVRKNHKRYKIQNLYVYANYNPLTHDTIIYDTLSVSLDNHIPSSSSYQYIILYKNKLRTKSKILIQSIFINNGKYFNLEDVQKTYDQLSNLKNYKYVDINLEEVQLNSFTSEVESGGLNCFIYLSRSPVQSFSIETEGRNSSGDLGIAANVIYNNKNIFSGAELFRLKLIGAMEMQKVVGESSGDILIFNTFKIGGEISLYLPKFLIPIKQEKFHKYFKPKTYMSFGLNYQNQPDYSRYITKMTFGYKWKESINKTHILNPIKINTVSINPDSSFMEIIKSYDKTLQNQYTDHIITSLEYSFIFRNQDIKKSRNFIYFRGNFESAGNLLSLSSSVLNEKKDQNGNYLLYNIKYSQFIRADIDFRYYNVISPKSSIIFRSVLGVGVPYGNSSVLPFEKSFYAGGANGIRAWRIRDLGPGGYINPVGISIDKIGDVKVELNLESRFPIYKFFHGAVFIDAGNIWLINKSDEFPHGEFRFDNVLNQMAVGGGFGARFDFSFFVLRLDFAVPMRKPDRPDKEKWVFNNIGLDKFVINFGIGYPF